MQAVQVTLFRLGTSAEGANLRARMQSACLLSDMESFKAANPGCCLSDFVRWYAPRDWLEEEVIDEEGRVGVRGQSAHTDLLGSLFGHKGTISYSIWYFHLNSNHKNNACMYFKIDLDNVIIGGLSC